ncbi:MAG: hypothetical protein V1777_00155 [Candidatus Micrarchaeota archaeon]
MAIHPATKPSFSPKATLLRMNTIQKLELFGGNTQWNNCSPSSQNQAPKNNDSRISAPYPAGVYRSSTTNKQRLFNTRLAEFFFSQTPAKPKPNPSPKKPVGFKPKNAE